jgi:pro-apoptotic serine protease NMA111
MGAAARLGGRPAHEATMPNRTGFLALPLAALLLLLGCEQTGTIEAATPIPPTEGLGLSSEGSDRWEQTLERVTQAVVVLRVTTPRSFDTERAMSMLGTGVIVDAEQGLILTNRHLVTPGPVVAEAVLLNHEEVRLEAVYRDPVHDFGFYRFDPSQVRYMSVVALPLAPEAARVGLDIRVVGNDAGEKLSILRGTLARLDRPAPDYGRGAYNDFNTFYYQAASSTSGGSSGSPVVDIEGRVVALNAGGRVMAASSFYLPLHRVVRALERLQRGEVVPRGTLQTVFQYEPYDELTRLGLRQETQTMMRAAFPERIGMLVVRQTLPAGPGARQLEPGDILVAVNGQPISDFSALAEVLDESVGRGVRLDLERNGQPLQVELTVGDLHAITPAEYVEMGGGVVHALSYQQARSFNLPVQGLYIAQAGYMLGTAQVPSFARLVSLDGQPLNDLETLWQLLSAKADREPGTVRYSSLEDARHEEVAVIQVDRRWFPMQHCRRDDTTGLWPCESAPPPPESPVVQARSTTFSTGGPEPVRSLASSLVTVDFDIPIRIEGVWGSHFRGTGLVVDAERGLVVVDRDTVPVALGDLSLTFARSLRVPGRVRFVHPIHNFAIIEYDPAALGDTPVTSAQLVSELPEAGTPVWLVGIGMGGRTVWRETRVADVSPVLSLSFDGRPQFRESNLEAISVENRTPTIGGVLARDNGDVLAFWASFPGNDFEDGFRGLPSELIEMVLDPMRRDEAVVYRTLGATLGVLELADARERGLQEAWADRLEEHDSERRQVLTVRRLYAGFPVVEHLQEGDLLLAVDGQPVTRFLEVEHATQRPTVELEVFRQGEVVTETVPTRELTGHGVERVIVWSGAVLHEPHLEVASQYGLDEAGVFVAWQWFGSPADRYLLRPTELIVAVDGQPTPDLDAFVAAVTAPRERASLLIRTVNLEGHPRALTLEPDGHYWPAREFRLTDEGWRTREL